MNAMPQQGADAALAALALVEACNEDNEINKRAIISGTDAAHLVLGLVVLASGLRAAAAAAMSLTPAGLDEMVRAMYLAHVGGES